MGRRGNFAELREGGGFSGEEEIGERLKNGILIPAELRGMQVGGVGNKCCLPSIEWQQTTDEYIEVPSEVVTSCW